MQSEQLHFIVVGLKLLQNVSGTSGLQVSRFETLSLKTPFNEKRHLNKQSLCDVEKCHNGGVQSGVITRQTKPVGGTG